ncbi:hypothetical protein CFB81_16950 [Burkholderia sp. AU28863]|nr:DUF3732 domain-containing protein [Burkholderia sp. AU28863]OXI66452.1 hypothetical protein CFB81_16950 [Burkholderia sp. AU28863]
MKLQVVEIVLWPRKGGFEPRRVPFALNSANVITGASKTGKSSIIPIIDYCLASDRCSIPVGLIRQTVSWFGIVVQTDEGQKLLARPEPGKQPSSGEMYLAEAEKISVPPVISEGNTTVKQVKTMLDRVAQLTNLGTDADNQGSGYSGRPSFRDLMAFCFQPQNVVANPDVLFYRADTTEYREKLRAIFPYVLGATTPESLEKRWELDCLKRELRVKQREVDAYAKASATWRANLENWVREAYELGLIDKEALKSKDEAHVLSILSKLVESEVPEKPISADALEDSAIEYAELQKEESSLNGELAEVRHRLTRLSELKGSVSQYEISLGTRKDRLSLSRWLRNQAQDVSESTCPICAQSLKSHSATVDAMCDALAVVESDARRVSRAPSVFDRDWVVLNDKMRELTDKLNAVSVRRKGIEQRSAKAKQQRLATNQVARYLGALEQALVVYYGRENPGAAKALEEIAGRIQSLQSELSKENYEAKLASVLKRLKKSMEKLASKLDAEDPDASVNLDIKELTVRVGDASGRSDFLWQLGSGANWLTYHVAATLALHALFLRLTNSPVPGLLAFDQPSQVYFPRKLASKRGDLDPKIDDDEDAEAVRRFFKVFGMATATFKGDFQIIVVDHASRDIWGGLEGINPVEEWRNGKKLVPLAWIEAMRLDGSAIADE